MFEFWIDHEDTYYTTYIDFDEFKWTETNTHGNDLVGQTNWRYPNALLLSHLNDAQVAVVDTTSKTSIKTYVKDEQTLYQRVNIEVDTIDYEFVAEYTYDGTDFSSLITFESCSQTWNAPSELVWQDCENLLDAGIEVKIETTTNFVGVANDWPVAGS